MTRRVLQIWALLVVTTAVALTTGLVVMLGVTPADEQVIEMVLQGGMTGAAAELDAAPDRETTRARLEARFGYPVVLVDKGPDDPVQYFQDAAGDSFVAAVLADGSGVRMGPLPQFGLPPSDRLAVMLFAVFGLTGLVALLVLFPQLRMLRAFESTVARLAGGDWGSRVGTDVPNYARPLAEAFDQMAGEIEGHIAARKHVLQVVSHELRTPLSRVQLGVDLLVAATERADRDDVVRRAGELERDVDDLDALVDELQEFVRLERPRRPEPAPHDVRALLDTIVAARVIDDRIQVTIAVRAAAPPPPVVADHRQLERAVGNLLSNALRHATGRVDLIAERQAAAWSISVTDDGPGVPAEARDRIWKPFERAVDTDVRGSGLGLAIVHRIVTDHGGKVAVTDSETGGACFGTTWPDVPPAAPDPDTQASG